jgi:hypothetical protein
MVIVLFVAILLSIHCLWWCCTGANLACLIQLATSLWLYWFIQLTIERLWLWGDIGDIYVCNAARWSSTLCLIQCLNMTHPGMCYSFLWGVVRGWPFSDLIAHWLVLCVA